MRVPRTIRLRQCAPVMRVATLVMAPRQRAMVVIIATLAFLVACSSSNEPGLAAEERAKALDATKQCTDTVESLAPTYQMVGPKLATALKMDRAAAQRLMRDSIELLISTREMLCNLSAATVQTVLDKASRDEQVGASRARVQAGLTRLAAARSAYDALLGAATAPTPMAPADEAALLERFSKALVGH